jgi:hypothetical protein
MTAAPTPLFNASIQHRIFGIIPPLIIPFSFSTFFVFISIL